MKLDRDEFLVTFDGGRATTDDLISIIRKAGYVSSIVTSDSAIADTPSQGDGDFSDPLLTEALATAKAENKLVLLDFKATWCVPCLRLEKETFADPSVAKLLKEFVLVKVDTDEHPDLAKHFGVVGLPDLRFLKSDGTEVKRLTDFQDAALFTETLKAVLSPGANQDTTTTESRKLLNDIINDATSFRQAFNDARGKTRVVMLVSPG